ncbi:hypothetical protein BDK51DRAFT_33805 [Blyttiomyces helicus]|uniref:Uncharacterized protein n=1 Tax=Blyttiomyces helicus TaxID=388810 RepID=A0A4P9W6N3_9FUNG|nr:hypothetical protein BDK51DRAFT_33805 [Blyttiomyces helicus]|eukprot:RKO87033.1 hypothetical protein BDK51DRAFT_33805 [Blyttiomyces helicus]
MSRNPAHKDILNDREGAVISHQSKIEVAIVDGLEIVYPFILTSPSHWNYRHRRRHLSRKWTLKLQARVLVLETEAPNPRPVCFLTRLQPDEACVLSTVLCRTVELSGLPISWIKNFKIIIGSYADVLRITFCILICQGSTLKLLRSQLCEQRVGSIFSKISERKRLRDWGPDGNSAELELKVDCEMAADTWH